MRLIKLGIISIVVLFGILYLLSLLIPSQVRVSRAIDISAPKDSVQRFIANLRTWQQWNTLVNNPQQAIKQVDAGHYRSGNISVTLQSVQPDTIVTQWLQQNGKEIEGKFALHDLGNVTTVQWYFDFRLKWYPWQKFGSIVFDKQLGPPMEFSLGKLKKLLETTP